ncbi:MAG: hypothetical protein H7066_14635 [Cytophagaceae bacterium]|nr:hypothetical protein [Gemmatimonadaceae bacterium]
MDGMDACTRRTCEGSVPSVVRRNIHAKKWSNGDLAFAISAAKMADIT